MGHTQGKLLSMLHTQRANATQQISPRGLRLRLRLCDEPVPLLELFQLLPQGLHLRLPMLEVTEEKLGVHEALSDVARMQAETCERSKENVGKMRHEEERNKEAGVGMESHRHALTRNQVSKPFASPVPASAARTHSPIEVHPASRTWTSSIGPSPR